MLKFKKIFLFILIQSNIIASQDLTSTLVSDIGHNTYIDYMKLSNNKKKLATSTNNSPEIILWDVLSSRQLKKINLALDQYWSLSGYEFSPDDLKLIVSYKHLGEYGVIIYDLEKNKSTNLIKSRGKFKGHYDIKIVKNEIILTRFDAIKIYDIDRNTLKKEYNINNKSELLISPDRKFFATYSNEYYMVFDYETGKKINQILYKFTDKNQFILNFNPYINFINSKEILIKLENGDLLKWDFLDESKNCKISNPHFTVNTMITVSKSGRYLATTSKRDKTLYLFDLKNFCGFANPSKEMFLGEENIPETIYFSNDESHINCVFDGEYDFGSIKKVDINSWSTISPYAPYEEVKEIDFNYNGKFIGFLDENNFFVTSDVYGNIYLYETNFNNLNLSIFRQFKTNKISPKSTKCINNDIFICYDKKIKKYNTLNKTEKNLFSISIEEEEEIINDTLILKGKSEFIDIAFLNKSQYYVIAKFQDFRFKLIFQPINQEDPIYYYTKDSINYKYPKNPFIQDDIDIKQYYLDLGKKYKNKDYYKLELRKINPTKSEKFIEVNWGIDYNDSLITEIINSKTGELVKTIEGIYKFNSDETLIASYSLKMNKIIIFNFETKTEFEVKVSEMNFENFSFSKNSKFIYYTDFGKKQKIIPIDSNYKLTDKQSKFILTSNRIINNLKVYEFDNEGRIKLKKDFSKEVPYGEFINKIESDSLIYINKDSKIHVYDLQNFDKLFVLKGHTNTVLDVFLNTDKSQIITYSTDNTFKFWDVKNGKEIYTRIFSDEKFELTTLPNSPFYMCSKEASKMMHFVTPDLKVIGFEQLDPIYNRPDVVLESICKNNSGIDKQLISLYRAAWEKRINRLGLDKEKIGKGEFEFPTAEIENNVLVPNEFGEITLNVKASDNKHFLNSYNIFINEVPLYGSQGISLSELKTRNWNATITIPLSFGKNKIQISVVNELGLENYKYPIFAYYTPVKKQIVSKTYFIGIGVDDFKQKIINNKKTKLDFCVKDVNDLSKVLSKKPNTIVKLYTNEQVNKENILSIKDFLKEKTTVDDCVIISCSSHGLLNNNFNFYLATYDIDFNNPSDRGIAYADLESLLDSIPARKKLLLLDACNSGENELINNNNNNRKVINFNEHEIDKLDISRRIDSESSDYYKSIRSFKKMNELFINTKNKTGSIIISAAGGMQKAMEGRSVKVNDKYIENGSFTYSILEFLNNTFYWTVNQLKEYVEKRVVEITNGEQEPTSRQETMEIDWKF
jgi:WD40 repeat protein